MEKPNPNYLRLLTAEELRELETQPGMHDCVRAEFSRRNGTNKASVPRSIRKECCVRYQAKPKRRMGRGKFKSVDDWSRRYGTRSAEVDPQATRSTDQTITELSLKGANSDNNAAILHGHEKAADRLAHILSGLSATHRKVIRRGQHVVEPGDSLREIGRKTGLHAMQVSRAFEAAKQADKRRIFKQAIQEKRQPAIAYTPYNPLGVPMATVMMPHRGPVLSRLLSGAGKNVGGPGSESEEEDKRNPFRKAFLRWKKCPCLRKLGNTESCEKCKKNEAKWKQARKNPVPERIGSHHAPQQDAQYSPMNGCYPNRQWVRVGSCDRLPCLDCRAELDRAGILAMP